MDDANNCDRPDLVSAVELYKSDIGKQRPPLMGAKLAIVFAVVMFTTTMWVEYHGVSFVYDQLYASLSDGSGEWDKSGTLKWMTVFGIVSAEVYLAKRSEQMSGQASRWFMRLGGLALVVFVIGGMLLAPASILQANSPMDEGGGISIFSQLGYIANGAVLAALLPLGILGNFIAIAWARKALRAVEQTTAADRRIAEASGLLAELEVTLTEAATTKRALSELPGDGNVADIFAAQAAAEIGEVGGEMFDLLTAREAALHQSADTPLKASKDELWNKLPIEKMRTRFDYLAAFTPSAVRSRIAPLIVPKEA